MDAFSMATRSTRSAANFRRLYLEPLETRCVLSGIQPTAQEQLFLEQLNDIRANPAGYGASIGLPAIETVAPAPPLAWDARLIQSAQLHSQDMNVNSYFSHYDLAGHDPGWRETQAGYPWTDWGESIAAGYPTDAATLQALIVDAGVSDLGHRLHLLAMNNSDESVGIGVVQNGTGSYRDYYTIDTGNTRDTRPFLTGVVFNDANGNGKYDVGEGLSGVTITVAGVGSAQAFEAGGYSIQLNPGKYTVTASGGQLVNPITQVVTVGPNNVRLNFTPSGTQLNNLPTNLLQVADTFTHSTENFQHFITNAYQVYLKRDPNTPELNYWVNRMSQGMTDEQVEASFIGSPEYIGSHGGSSAAWVSSMYQDLLARAASQSEISGWLQKMSTGMSAEQVALGFATSPEREAERVNATYQVVLGRQASASEIAYWVNRFENGATNEDVAAGFLASQEFYNNMGPGNVVNWLQAVYQDVLHRTASSSELTYWQTQLS
jgi:uncharacterized protein YkwD